MSTKLGAIQNDIYERLVDETPDRGKAGQIRIDWNDRAKLRQVIFRRLQASLGKHDQPFDVVWNSVFAGRVGAKPSFEYCVDHCLMRPRFLITIVENAIANAINRGHDIVDQNDIVDAVIQHSNYLVSDFGYEIRDTSGLNADILFSLIGLPAVVQKADVLQRFTDFGLSGSQPDEAFELFLWYGLIGLIGPRSQAHYIYDFDYSLKRLTAEARLVPSQTEYAINPALHVALSQ